MPKTYYSNKNNFSLIILWQIYLCCSGTLDVFIKIYLGKETKRKEMRLLETSIQKPLVQKAGVQISFLNLSTQGENSLENDSFNVGFRIRLQLVLMKKMWGSEWTLDILD